MDRTYQLTIVTPDGQVFNDQVEAMVAPGELGSFGVLPGHAPMVAALRPGRLSVTCRGERRHFNLGAGVAEIGRGQVVILADGAEQAGAPGQAGRKHA